MGKGSDIPDNCRSKMMQFLLESCTEGRLPHGKIAEAAARFSCNRKSVSRFWKTAKDQKARGEVICVSAKRKGRIRQPKYVINYAQIEALEVEKRGTIQSISVAIGVPKSTVGNWIKNHLLRPHTNAIRPLLKPHNMLTRLSFSLQALHYNSALNILKFKPMENTAHIDEKWFYLSRNSCRYYLTPMEADPLRVCQSKNFMPKVMFMCAASRPVFDVDGSVLFDGKIGIWPFVQEVTAQRDSIKRKKGTTEIKPIQSITRQVIKDCIIKQIVPAIKEKWPQCLSKNIMIQQDNARTHIKNTDVDFQQVANGDGFNIKMVQQPANSPECNVNNLGFFCAIQALQQRQKCRTADDLIAAVKHCFNILDPMTLNKVFLSLQCVLIEILKHKGHNNFKQPHMQKNALLRQGTLPMNLEVPEYLVRECIDYLIAEENTEGIEGLMHDMGISVPHEGGEVPDLNM